jgi:hypothetical protein
MPEGDVDRSEAWSFQDAALNGSYMSICRNRCAGSPGISGSVMCTTLASRVPFYRLPGVFAVYAAA